MPAFDDKRPTAAELASYEEAYRQNPRSEVAILLADAYSALGRCGEALEICQRVLTHTPDSVPARLSLGRAYIGMQQWKEAQTELLKVVKLDRSSPDGFRMLGEALMRRSDFERALPILQHAQNLSPSDARVLQMLKRARENRGLDPPLSAPAPQAASPPPPIASRTGGPRRPVAEFDAQPTRVAGDDYGGHLDDGDSSQAGGLPTKIRDSSATVKSPPPTRDDAALVNEDDPTRVGFDASEPTTERGDVTERSMISFADPDAGTTQRAMRPAALAAVPVPSAPVKRPPPLPAKGATGPSPALPAKGATGPSPAFPAKGATGQSPAIPIPPRPPAPPAAPAAAKPSALAKIPLKKAGESDRATLKPPAAPAPPPKKWPEPELESFESSESMAQHSPSLVADIDVDLNTPPPVSLPPVAKKPVPAKRPAEENGEARASFAPIAAEPPRPAAEPPKPAAKPAKQATAKKPEKAPDDADGEVRAAAPAPKAAKASSAAPAGATVMVAQAMQRAGQNHEDFLNQLLGAGLVSVPGVQARSAAELDLSPDIGGPAKRWGRSTSRAMIAVWLIAVLGAGAAYGIWWYVGKLRRAAVTRQLTEIAGKLETGGYLPMVGPSGAGELVRAAVKKETSLRTMAMSAEVQGMALRDYGEGDDNKFSLLVGQLKKRLIKLALPPTDPKLVEIRVAESAQALRAGKAAAAVAVLADVAQANPQDHQVLTALATAEIAVGDRAGARQHATSATVSHPNAATALALLGDLALDEGDFDASIKAYDAALKVDAKHPLALLGRGLARIEHARDLDSVMADVNAGISLTNGGPRVEQWRHLALGEYYLYREEDSELASKELDDAAKTTLGEPRYLARLALARLWQGKLAEAEKLRNSAVQIGGASWVGHPLIKNLDGELRLAHDQPDEAAKILGAGGKASPRLVLARARVALRLDQPDVAKDMLDTMLDEVPKDQSKYAVAQGYRELARGLAAKGQGAQDKKEREAAAAELAKLARGSKSGLVRALSGELQLAMGDFAGARRDLDQASDGNPELYRTRVLLARAYLGEGKKDDALKALEDSVKDNPAYGTALSELGRLYESAGRHDDAISTLARAQAAGRTSWQDDLAMAEAYLGKGQAADAEASLDRAAKEPGASSEEIARVRALLSGPPAGDVPAPKKKAPPPRRRHR